jgi:hypothetical protein
MSYKTKTLYISQSTIPGAGKGLFTSEAIKKGEKIIEYKGRIRTWKEVSNASVFNGYVFYVNRSHVIDAKTYIQSLARYANDAHGLTRVKGIINNAEYQKDDKKVYIHATRNIPAGAEIFVGYGKDYWDVVKENMKLEEAEKKV